MGPAGLEELVVQVAVVLVEQLVVTSAEMEQQTLVEVAVVDRNRHQHLMPVPMVATVAQALSVFVILIRMMLQVLQQVLHLFLQVEDIESISGPHLGVSHYNGTLCRNR